MQASPQPIQPTPYQAQPIQATPGSAPPGYSSPGADAPPAYAPSAASDVPAYPALSEADGAPPAYGQAMGDTASGPSAPPAYS